MLRLQRIVASLWLMGLSCAWFASAQDLLLRPSPPTELKLVQIGHGKTKSGVKTAFRVYEAPDGNRGKVFYVKYDSLQASQEEIERWVKVTPKITSREQNQVNKKGQLISDRILGVQNLPEPDKKEFVIIRRDDLNCYLIESASLEVATQIEDLIEHR
jgi:hypothetical protein